MDPVHDKGVHGPGPYFDGPGPSTGSTEGVHGPGVHVLYFPVLNTSQLPGIYENFNVARLLSKHNDKKHKYKKEQSSHYYSSAFYF